MPRRATRCCGRPVISRSSNHTRPSVGAISPEISRKNVVLPAPLARGRSAPRPPRHDAESSFPAENYRDLHEARLLALAVPKAYGGVGADPIAYVHALREMAKGCSATGLTFNMHSTVTGFIAS